MRTIKFRKRYIGSRTELDDIVNKEYVMFFEVRGDYEVCFDRIIKWVLASAQFKRDFNTWFVLKGYTLNYYYDIPKELRLQDTKTYYGINIDELDDDGHDYCVLFGDEMRGIMLKDLLESIEDEAKEKGINWRLDEEYCPSELASVIKRYIEYQV